jgi:hypothetical protein
LFNQKNQNAEISASNRFIQTFPRFGILVARRDFDQLVAEWRNATLLAVSMMLVGVVLMLGILYLLTTLKLVFVNRMLSFLDFSLLATGAIFSLAGYNISVYLRAHKREVLLTAGMLSGVVMGVLVW